MPSIRRRELVLLLIGLGEESDLSEGLGGITRLQKYLYLLEKEGGVTPDGDGFRFEAWKKGPYSAKLYDDLEFLENLGLLRSHTTGDVTDDEEVEAKELATLTFDDLLGEDGPGAAKNEKLAEENADYSERSFELTPEGVAHVRSALQNPEYTPVIESVRRVKSRFAHHSLHDLLHYVYTKYPEMTSESDIREKVLRRGRGR